MQNTLLQEKTVNSKKLLRIFSAAAFASTILFVILTFTAMFTYPGGSNFNKDSAGYSFSTNFFSDLGRRVSFNGEPQMLTSVLFSLALGIVGFAIIPLFILTPSLYAQRGKKAAHAGAAVGILAGICYIGVALTPWDLYLYPHMKFVQGAFSLITVAMILLTVSFIQHGGFGRIYPAVSGIFSVMAVVYVWLLFFGPSFNTPHGLAVQVAAQKIIVYAEIAAIAVTVHGIYRVNRSR